MQGDGDRESHASLSWVCSKPYSASLESVLIWINMRPTCLSGACERKRPHPDLRSVDMASPPDLHDPSTLTHINRREILYCNPWKRIAQKFAHRQLGRGSVDNLPPAQRSTLVTGVAWTFIVLGGFAAFVCLMQMIMVAVIFPHGVMPRIASQGDALVGEFARLIFNHIQV